MALLTNTATFAVGAASLEYVEVSVVVLPPAPSSEGKGRLVHPVLGTLDYAHPPTSWTNLDTDVIAPPVWSSAKTLIGSANTLWPGDLRDVTCVERWTTDRGQLRLLMGQFRTMLAMLLDPPDPATATVLWYPSYATALGYKVALVGLTVGGQGITLNWVSRATEYGYDDEGISTGDVELTLKILGRPD